MTRSKSSASAPGREQTVGEWLRAAEPRAPARLAARVESAVEAGKTRDASEAADICLNAASALLRDVVARSTVGRESALDLLAVDALVTYAFEAAAEVPASVRQRALGAIAQLAAAGAHAS